MACSQNEHTGALQKTRPATKEYIANYDAIFRKDKVKENKTIPEGYEESLKRFINIITDE